MRVRGAVLLHTVRWHQLPRRSAMLPSGQAHTLADAFPTLEPCGDISNRSEQLAANPAQLSLCRFILLSALASVVADPAKEADKVTADPAKYTRRYEGVGRTGTPFAVDVLRERFLGPELFFQPQLYAGGHSGAWQGGSMEGLGVKYGWGRGAALAFFFRELAPSTKPPQPPCNRLAHTAARGD